jgi:hypothetical protein
MGHLLELPGKTRAQVRPNPCVLAPWVHRAAPAMTASGRAGSFRNGRRS